MAGGAGVSGTTCHEVGLGWVWLIEGGINSLLQYKLHLGMLRRQTIFRDAQRPAV